jgi:diaminopimelate decarboxylase
VRRRARQYCEAADAAYPGDTTVAYAGKALLTTAVCRLIDQEGLWLDVVSGGELHTALEADFPPEHIIFHGNNKSRDELEMALEAGVGRIALDNLSELELLQQLSGRCEGERPKLLLRITPGVEAHTHSHIQTGQVDTKFGLSIKYGQAELAVERVLNELPQFELVGVHAHIGSQLLALEPYKLAVSRVFDFLNTVRERHGFVAREVDLGGGLGIRYTGGEQPPAVEAFVQAVARAVVGGAKSCDYPLPRLVIEPGRSLVGEAGLTLYTVGAVKELPQLRRLAAVDGGMADNPRPALYDAEYAAVPGQRKAETDPAEIPLSLVGRFCESGDVVIRQLQFGGLERGDLVAVLSTGAYNYSMASNYNRVPRPAMVLVRKGQSAVAVRRETLADVVRYDRIPAWLE